MRRRASAVVVSSADKAIDNANAQGSCDPGYCLKYTRQWLGIGSREADAKDAWDTAIGKHPDDKSPPRGAPVFWKGGTNGHGHIALAKADNMRTTDKPTGTVANDPGDYPRRQWGLEYVGWAEGFNGVRIPYLGDPYAWAAKGDVHVSKLKQGQADSQSVSRLRYRLMNLKDLPEGKKPGYGTSDSSVGADYGPDVAEAVMWWQRNVYPDDKPDGPTDGSSISNPQANHLFGDNYNVIEK